MDSSLNARWYVIQTKPYKEVFAKEQLEKRDVNCYLPVITPLTEYGRRKKSSFSRKSECYEGVPFFPRYFFAEFDVEYIHTTRIKSTPGVSNIVNFGGVPATMTGREIVELQNQIERIIPHLLAEATPKKGEHVEIISGSFEGMPAIFEAGDGDKRSILLMELLGNTLRHSIENCDFKLLK
ncbi:transcription/translation regulatory transformer protein RfaH [Rahnella sp. ChDrAdgB13]|uniref:transcription/translation regulatory transformer protein RfaH n=1 Tax=Rahnella sp. ChDrAdgB13 TaxID=1850581 RepID=UPI001AD858BD|nr:transcription/translation regulatory transformer protein RfaH [Rahnella sp. ChDrAdgB13]